VVDDPAKDFVRGTLHRVIPRELLSIFYKLVEKTSARVGIVDCLDRADDHTYAEGEAAERA